MVWNVYEDKDLRIIHEDNCSWFDWNLYIKYSGKEDKYNIPSKILGESQVTKRGELESKLDAINPKIRDSLKNAGLTVDALHVVLCVAGLDIIDTHARDRDTEH
jgi:hypothetical protein